MKQFGLIGKTLKHSFSQTYFTNKFAVLQLDCSYLNFELEQIEEFPALVSSLQGLHGLNITIPYKKEVIRFLDGANDIVQQTGACNCIKIINGRLHGFNTDVIGFRNSLLPKLKPQHKKALILGTGGAAEAVAYVLEQSGIDYKMVSRTKSAAFINYEAIDEKSIAEYPLIINASPAGMYPHIHQFPDIPYNKLTADHLLYDLIYNPAKTVFLKEGEKRGAQTCNGYEMLVLQAEESWRIWNDSTIS